MRSMLAGPGKALDTQTRGYFEHRFGRDFTGVRIHKDDQAARSASQLGARAYTVGNHIVFGKSQFSPGSSEGRRLIAHELTHVIQQGRTDETIVYPGASENDDTTLISASEKADADASASPVPVTGSVDTMVQRDSCPCCVDSVAIKNVTQIDNTTHMGHSFDFEIAMEHPMSGPAGSCKLEWWERTNIPAIPGHKPNTWTDMYQLYPQSPTFEPWKNRAAACGTSELVSINDPPSLAKRPGRTVTRTLEFDLKVYSGPPVSTNPCPNPVKTATATQVLTMVSGAPDWSASSFTTP